MEGGLCSYKSPRVDKILYYTKIKAKCKEFLHWRFDWVDRPWIGQGKIMSCHSSPCDYTVFPGLSGSFRDGGFAAVSSAESPAGYPHENSNNRKIERAQMTMGKGKRPLFSLSPSHRAPRAFFIFLRRLPMTQRGLCEGERFCGRREVRGSNNLKPLKGKGIIELIRQKGWQGRGGSL